MFADSSGDGIPLWYLGMIENLDEPRKYNWGGAVLAYLYRNLCLASSPSCKSMHGPTMLLQHWSWTRFQIHRPLPGSQPNWGAETEDTCPSFADMWKGPHNWENSSHGATSGPGIPRDQIQKLTDNMVNWQPYASVYHNLSRTTRADQVHCNKVIFFLSFMSSHL